MTRLVLRCRVVVVIGWLVVLVAAIHALPTLASVVNNDDTSFLPASAPSVRAEQLMSSVSPSADAPASGVLVEASAGGALTASDLAAMSTLEAGARRVGGVSAVGNGATSIDGEARTATVVFDAAAGAGGKAGRLAVQGIRSRFPAIAGLGFYLTGPLPELVDQQLAAASTETNVVLVTALLVLVLLLLALRAVGAPLVVLASSGLALGLAGPVIAWSTHLGVQISSLLQLLLTALVLGAGTDYGLFLLFRVRENLALGMEHDEAIVTAMALVGESITFSAATVIAALLSLLLASFGLYRGVGPGLAIGVAVVLVVNLTFLPAALSICGPRLFWPWRPRRGMPRRAWGAVSASTTRRPLLALSCVLALLGVLAGFLVRYAPSGFNPGGAIAASNSGLGEEAVVEHFGALEVASSDVVFRLPESVWREPELLARAESGLRSSGEFNGVSGPLDVGSDTIPPGWLNAAYDSLGPPQDLPATPPAQLGSQAAAYELYRATAQLISADGRTVQFHVSLAAGSPGSTAAMQAIPAVRAAAARVAASIGATSFGVAGVAAGAYDVSETSTRDMVTVVPVVLVLLALLLALLVRSLVAPLYLVASVGLSYLAALGLAVAIFVVAGHGPGVNFTLPFFMFVFVMALGQDYNILVMSRIREENRRLPLAGAVASAMSATGTTVSAAGAILAGTFGMLAVTTSGQIRQIGTGLALGILIDTFLVRTVMLPSIVVMLGRLNWWPGRVPQGGRAAEAAPIQLTQIAITKTS